MAIGTAPEFPSRRKRRSARASGSPTGRPFHLYSPRSVCVPSAGQGAVDSALAVVGILAGGTGYSRIRPGPYRMMGGAVPGATHAADEMAGHLGHRQPLRKVETAGVDIEASRRPA